MAPKIKSSNAGNIKYAKEKPQMLPLSEKVNY
jgi:hypothetical protein